MYVTKREEQSEHLEILFLSGVKHWLKVFFELSAAFVLGKPIGSSKEHTAVTVLPRLALSLYDMTPKPSKSLWKQIP